MIKKVILSLFIVGCLMTWSACGNQSETDKGEKFERKSKLKKEKKESKEESKEEQEGAQLVDLGLSVKWADRNVGADYPSDIGSQLELEKAYYAIREEWDDRRLPSRYEIDELVRNCTWEWDTQEGANGYTITGPNGNSIFLPITDEIELPTVESEEAKSKMYYTPNEFDAGSIGLYWSHSLIGFEEGVFTLGFSSNNFGVKIPSSPYALICARPVGMSEHDEYDKEKYEEAIDEAIAHGEIPEPEPVQNSLKFTEPVISSDDYYDEDEELKSQDELLAEERSIRSVDISDGTDDIEVAHEELFEAPVVEEEAPEVVHNVVEQMPTFPGGETALMQYIGTNLKYPQLAAEQGIQGRVVLRFVVRKDGSIGDVVVVRSLDPSCDKEAVRVVKSLPRFTPGKQNGNPVNVWYTLPFQFKLM